MGTFKVLSLNINHTNNMSNVIDILKSDKPSLLFLQEVPVDTEQLSGIVARLGYQAYVSLPFDLTPGVGVIYLANLPVDSILPLEPGRLLYIKASDWSFINVYGPSGNNKKQDRHIMFSETLPRNMLLKHIQPILIGDFNCVTSPLDCETNYSNKKCESLKRLLETFNYSDCYRHIWPHKREYSFFRRGCTPSRIDNAFFPQRALVNVVNVSYFSSLSDHNGLSIEFTGQMAPPVIRPRLYWKLNSTCLKHADFMPNFVDLWHRMLARECEFSSPDLWWEELTKPSIRDFLIRFSKMVSESKKTTKLFLYELLKKYLGDKNFVKAKPIKERLALMITEDSFGYSIQSPDKITVEEEKVGLYHANKAYKTSAATSLSRLEIGGIESTDPVEIEQEIRGHFGAVLNGHHRSDPAGGQPIDTGIPFQPDYTDLDEFLEDIGELDEGEADSLEGQLTLEELFTALEGCANDKAPGEDGISYEFYKRTKELTGPALVRVYNAQLNSGDLIKSHRSSVTRLIPKTKGIPSAGKLRPLALLNCDYKIQSKVLTNRLNPVLDSVLKSRQLCMKKEQNILFGCTDLISSISYVNAKNLNAFLVSYDIFKAFDKTNISFVIKVMEKMKFKKNFLFWIKSIHKNISTSFLLNNISEAIDILFSLRQGDSLSMALFIILVEPLLLMISKVLKGLKVGKVVQREEGYVDDVGGVSTDPNDLLLVDNIFTKFENLSGTVLNRSKCKIMGLGGWKGRVDWPLPWLEPVDSIKIYGVNFCPTIPETSLLSWQKCKEGFNNCLNSWKARSLPFLSQKTFVLKSFALSKLWYLAQVLPVPKAVITDFEQRIGSFLWRGRLERLPLPELSNLVKEGGLGLPNIQAKCDALFLKHLTRVLSTPSQTRDHLLYWVGLRLRKMFPSLTPPMTAEMIPPYFLHGVRLLEDRALPEQINLTNLNRLSTKQIYGAFTSTPPPPKIMEKRSLDWGVVWERLNDPILSREALDISFSLLHDIYPTKVRLNKCNQHPTGFCTHCPRTLDTGIHMFVECGFIIHLWIYIKNLMIRNGIVLNILVCDRSCLFFDIEVARDKLKSYLFIISNYILFVHQNKNNISTVNDLKSFLMHRKGSNIVISF